MDLGEEFNLEGEAVTVTSEAEVSSLIHPNAVLTSADILGPDQFDSVDSNPHLTATHSSAGGDSDPRTQQLEQALAQCQRYIDDLKAQLTDQELLVDQLAATEEFSHIQQQAITTLHRQLEQHKQLAVELETHRRAQVALEAELEQKKSLVQVQTGEVETLRAQLTHHQAALDQFKDQTERLSSEIQLSQDNAVQETQQRIVAQRTAERLRQQLRERDVTIQALEAKLQQIEGSVMNQQEIIHALKQADQPDSQKNQVIQGLSSHLLQTQARVTELEAELSNQSIMQAQYQHSMQEFESVAQGFQSRSQELEQQVAEMQEQILQQAQQASEYETAIQHWKDRGLTAEQGVSQLKQVIERLLCDRSFPEGMSAHQLETAITDMTQSLDSTLQISEVAGSHRVKKLDLPALVHRWRHSRR
jgi:chromosome segregation ATPase